MEGKSLPAGLELRVRGMRAGDLHTVACGERLKSTKPGKPQYGIVRHGTVRHGTVRHWARAVRASGLGRGHHGQSTAVLIMWGIATQAAHMHMVFLNALRTTALAVGSATWEGEHAALGTDPPLH